MKKYTKYYFVSILAGITISCVGSAFGAITDGSDRGSVKSWGPWDKMISPAAGPAPVIAMKIASLYTPPNYTPNVDIKVARTELSCQPGSTCGYGVRQENRTSVDRRIGYGSPTAHQVVATTTLTPDTNVADWHPENLVTPDNANLGKSTQAITFKSNTGSNQLIYNNGTWSTLSTFGGVSSTSPEPDSLLSLSGKNLRDGSSAQFAPESMNALVPATVDGTGTLPEYASSDYDKPIYSFIRAYYNYFGLSPFGSFEVRHNSTIQNYFGYDIGISFVKTIMFDSDDLFSGGSSVEVITANVVGIPTSLEQIDHLVNAGSIQASYHGTSFDLSGTPQAPVTINVDFALGTWDGSWNNGVDGNLDVVGNVINGAVGFNASGTIYGNTIHATNVSALDGTVQGYVDGAFFNANGNAVAGVSDIVKTGFGITVNQDQTVTYDPTNPRYENAQNVSLFVAVDESRSEQ